jgi:hypothetical protein
MAQINYLTVGGDTLPSVAESCGHPGEWQEILAVNPWIPENGDYLNVPPGTNVLLPPDWTPAGYDDPDADAAAQAQGSSVVPASSMTAAELIGLARTATTETELDAIAAAAGERVSVLDAVAARQNQLGL